MTARFHRRILLGVTGGVAAYKAAELTRLLVKARIDVQVAMTEAACGFVAPATFQALSGKPVLTDLWDPRIPNRMAHIELSRHADAILIAPASADFIAKIAQGTADDLLSTTVAARNCPLLVAPAMNREMWANPANQRNIHKLKTDGVILVGPDVGEQACGELGEGRLVEPEQLLQAVLALYPPQRLAGRKAVVTAGPTFESIDPVRGITNSSSGKMGYAVAEALRDEGAEVVLVSGPTALNPPAGCTVVAVKSAADMLSAVQAALPGAAFFFAVAAVADYTPQAPAAHKLKKSGEPLTLTLVPTVDILATVAQQANPPFCVGFAAESRDLATYAETKRRTKRVPLIVGNLAQRALGQDDNEIVLFDAGGAHPLPPAPKSVLARQLVDHAIRLEQTQGAP
ncbi:MAG: bifunctional phosphopantothenoylcysteine decarboxylase/phosphopantothenate--cysteine ligase CoaBC [Betaproteobacteria bacterium]|nr:bifunctional phosphopantothenoylcysteine decarboxylase/phosphopantothenate--cysteine ligase CoaBC [Betaproteobacteria bacterium]